MTNPSLLEACYKKYMKNIHEWLPDGGLIQVDLTLLHRLNLLHYYRKDLHDPVLTRYFHIIDSEEKVTLVNEQFVVWIVPDKWEEMPLTYTLIALNKHETVQLELGFVTQGVYNNSSLVLRILEKLLLEIQATEDLMLKLKT